MLKLKRFVLIAFALGVLSPAASAQVLPMDPYRLAATDLIELFTSGVNHTGVYIAFEQCPSQSERHDSVFTGIAELQLSEPSSIWLATLWSAGTRLCDEPRLTGWFRREFERFPSPDSKIFFAKLMLTPPTASNVELVREWLVSAPLGQEHLTAGLRALADATPVRVRLETIDLVGRQVPLPDAFLSLELFFLRHRDAHQTRSALLKSIVNHPTGPSALRLLTFLLTDARENPPADPWRAELVSGLAELAAASPPHIRGTAAAGLQALRQ